MNDYSEGAHPDILKALEATGFTQEEGYGLDKHSLRAKDLIRELVKDKDAEVIFLTGGTQTNLLAISSALRPHEACMGATTAHIATHETGAIEATGHKIVTAETTDGKLSPPLLQPLLDAHYFEHMVKPRLVYISNPTELGTISTKKELIELRTFCDQKGLILYCDGARLGCALEAAGNDLSLQDMYMLTDAFSIGGTKIGALLGEALVIRKKEMQEDIRYLAKQRGALLAKGAVLGIQFEQLLQDGLYFKLAGHSIDCAQKLAEEMGKMGIPFLIDSPTNQIFPILEDTVIAQLEKDYSFYTWQKTDSNHSAVRLVTSWATPMKTVHNFIQALGALLEKD
jgi:threonine aldolase